MTAILIGGTFMLAGPLLDHHVDAAAELLGVMPLIGGHVSPIVLSALAWSLHAFGWIPFAMHTERFVRLRTGFEEEPKKVKHGRSAVRKR